MGSTTAPQFNLESSVATFPQSKEITSTVRVLQLEANKSIKLDSIIRNAPIFSDTDEAANQLTTVEKEKKIVIQDAIKITYQAYSEVVPGPRNVKLYQELYWDGVTPTQVIVEVKDIPTGSSTVTDVALPD